MPDPFDAFAAAYSAIRAEFATLRWQILNLEAKITDLSQRLPDDLIADGWHVELRHDYRVQGEWYTYWLVAKDDRCVKGQGLTDAEALDQIRQEISSSGDDREDEAA